MLAMALGFQYQPIVLLMNYNMSIRVDCDHYNWGHNLCLHANERRRTLSDTLSLPRPGYLINAFILQKRTLLPTPSSQDRAYG